MITLPIQACTVNKFYRTYAGRILISKDGKDFKKLVQAYLTNYTKIMGKVKLIIEVYFKDKRKRDLDNFAKVLIDCLKNKLFEDDDQIYELQMKKYIACDEDKICIDVISLEDN
tara:strand:- start:1184 stop:1525 length:342 start_codon:yes stop_codon:yes gene_type:complete